jgi:hypothetical protein
MQLTSPPWNRTANGHSELSGGYVSYNAPKYFHKIHIFLQPRTIESDVLPGTEWIRRRQIGGRETVQEDTTSASCQIEARGLGEDLIRNRGIGSRRCGRASKDTFCALLTLQNDRKEPRDLPVDPSGDFQLMTVRGVEQPDTIVKLKNPPI